MTADEDSPIYRDLMRFKPDELTPNGWAVRAGVSRTVWADMRRHGNPSRRTLEKLLAAASSSLAEFEALRLGRQTSASSAASGSLEDKKAWEWSPARLPTLPLFATGLAGEWGEAGSGVELTEVRWDQLIDRLERPPSLVADRDAYALTVVGDSMWPRFKPGRQIAVSPRAPVAIGDDVIVRLRSSEASQPVLIKALVRRSNGGIELRQFNPNLAFNVDDDQIDAIHKVVGELI
jgi:phage repressor protein C with HTH and peptisase S24 domain